MNRVLRELLEGTLLQGSELAGAARRPVRARADGWRFIVPERERSTSRCREGASERRAAAAPLPVSRSKSVMRFKMIALLGLVVGLGGCGGGGGAAASGKATLPEAKRSGSK